MNRAIIMAGLPGTGKSTLREKLLEDFSDYVFIYSTDDYIEDIASIQKTTYSDVFQANIKSATELMNQRLADELNQNTDILWDQTNLNEKKRSHIIRQFPKNYQVECHCILPPRDVDEESELWRRLESREGKSIPENVIRNMWNSFSIPNEQEGFDVIYYYDMYGEKVNEQEYMGGQ